MEKNKIGVAVVHEICPVCGKPINEQIVMNRIPSYKSVKEIEDANGKAIGYSKTACEECAKYKDKVVYCILIDASKSTDNNPYRTGEIYGIKKDYPLFLEHPEFINKTEDDVSFCFMDKKAAKECGFIK